MKSPEKTVRHPIITEKSTILREATGVYCFRADLRANKIEIARAVEQLFDVKVADVRTSRVKGKMRRMGRKVGKRPDCSASAAGERSAQLQLTEMNSSRRRNRASSATWPRAAT